MNAGSSGIGMHFAAKHADMAFVAFHDVDIERGRAQLAEMRRIGREDYGRRDFQIWTSCRVVCRPTEKEAREYSDYYINEKGDFGAIETLVRERAGQDPNMPPEMLDRLKRRLAAGWGGYALVGTPEQIVAELIRLSAIGLDGVVLSWVNYHDEIGQWTAEIMPLLEQAGLRQPHRRG